MLVLSFLGSFLLDVLDTQHLGTQDVGVTVGQLHVGFVLLLILCYLFSTITLGLSHVFFHTNSFNSKSFFCAWMTSNIHPTLCFGHEKSFTEMESPYS